MTQRIFLKWSISRPQSFRYRRFDIYAIQPDRQPSVVQCAANLPVPGQEDCSVLFHIALPPASTPFPPLRQANTVTPFAFRCPRRTRLVIPMEILFKKWDQVFRNSLPNCWTGIRSYCIITTISDPRPAIRNKRQCTMPSHHKELPCPEFRTQENAKKLASDPRTDLP